MFKEQKKAKDTPQPEKNGFCMSLSLFLCLVGSAVSLTLVSSLALASGLVSKSCVGSCLVSGLVVCVFCVFCVWFGFVGRGKMLTL